MSSPNWREELPKKVFAMKIVIGAMVAGCIIMLAVVLIVSNSFAVIPEMRWMTGGAPVAAAYALIVRAIVPVMISGAGRNTILRNLRGTINEKGSEAHPKNFDEVENEAGRQLIDWLQRKIVLTAACLEGAAFLLITGYLLARSSILLAAVGVVIVLLLSIFPTLNRSSRWIEDQLRLLKEGY